MDIFQRINLNVVKAVCFDLDGTIYQGTELVEGADASIRFFRKNLNNIMETENCL